MVFSAEGYPKAASLTTCVRVYVCAHAQGRVAPEPEPAQSDVVAVGYVSNGTANGKAPSPVVDI